MRERRSTRTLAGPTMATGDSGLVTAPGVAICQCLQVASDRTSSQLAATYPLFRVTIKARNSPSPKPGRLVVVLVLIDMRVPGTIRALPLNDGALYGIVLGVIDLPVVLPTSPSSQCGAAAAPPGGPTTKVWRKVWQSNRKYWLSAGRSGRI
jgi:hypothetical protein